MSNELEEIEYNKKIQEHIQLGKDLNIMMATPPAIVDKLQGKIRDFMQGLPEKRLRTEEDWDMLESYSMRIPKNLTQLIKRRQQAQNLMDRLDVQEKQLKFELKLTAQEQFGKQRQLDNRDKELAIYMDDRYEQSVIQLNMQKNLIKYLDETIEQYRYLNNTINTRVEIVKLRKDLGY